MPSLRGIAAATDSLQQTWSPSSPHPPIARKLLPGRKNSASRWDLGIRHTEAYNKSGDGHDRKFIAQISPCHLLSNSLIAEVPKGVCKHSTVAVLAYLQSHLLHFHAFPMSNKDNKACQLLVLSGHRDAEQISPAQFGCTSL